MQVDDEPLSSESDESPESKTLLERILDHIQNSSLLIFPQSSTLRSWCQLCVESEDDQEAAKKNQAGGDQQQE